MSEVEYTWRDSELRSRPLLALNWVGARLARFGLDLPSLTPASVMKAAAKMAGSDDFGSDSYREPLEVFLRSCEDEAELTTFGRLLDLEDAGVGAGQPHRAAPLVRSTTPRCGTSASSARGSSSGCRAPGPACCPSCSGSIRWPGRCCQWEAAHPVPPATLEEAAEDPRIARTAKDLDGLMKLNPPLKAMHPFGATLAEECVALFMYDVRALALETQAHVPSYARWLEQADMTPAYAQHRLALQTLQSRQPTERWILKTPNHLWHLDAMLTAYPDARVIWTHRDPGPVVTSLASLANASQRLLTSRTRPAPDGRGVEAQVRLRPALGDGLRREGRRRLVPAPPLRRPDGRPGRGGPRGSTATSARRSARSTPGACSAFLEHRPQDAFGRHRYDPADFGWTYAGLDAEFGDYIERTGSRRRDGPRFRLPPRGGRRAAPGARNPGAAEISGTPGC